MVSNSGQDENGKYKGGKAGDQTGKEWYVRTWYNGGWTVVLRHPNAEVREMIAQLSEESANNDFVGYDQNQRLTYWTQLVKANYRPKNIKVACEDDCSAGVSANVKATGYLLGIDKLKAISEGGTTSTIKENFTKAGFKALTAKKYLTSEKYLLRGDILLNEGHHVATNLTNGSATTTTTTSTTAKSYVKKAQTALNTYINAKLDVDGELGTLTRKATAKALQYSLNRDYGARLVVDGDVGAKTKSAYKGKVVKKGSRSYLVSWCEIALMLLGYYTDTVEFAGIFGSNMDKATRAFQKVNGLTVDGEIGQNTINKLLTKLKLV